MDNQNNSGSTRNNDVVFYKDLRFWLIIALIAAFLAFTLIQFPTGNG